MRAISNRTSPRAALCLAALSLAFAGCGESPGNEDAGPDVDAGAVTDDAFLVASRIRTPSGRSVLLFVVDDLDRERTLDGSTGLEIGGQSRAFVYEGAVYVAEGESGEIARYTVTDDRELVFDQRFSLSGLGVTNFRSSFAFISPTRAYYIDPGRRFVAVWNPTAMELDGTFELPDPPEGLSVAGGNPEIVGDRVLMPVSFTNLQGALEPTVTVWSFSTTEDGLQDVFTDSRCAIAGSGFADDRGDYYVLGDSGDGSFDLFGLTDLPDACVLRVQSGADGFDPDFQTVMPALVEADQVSGMVGRADGTFVTRTLDPEFDPSSVSDPTLFFALEVWIWKSVSLDDESVVELGLPASGISFPPFVIDGAFYVQQLDEETQGTQLFRFDGTVSTPGLSVAGDVQRVARLR